MCKNGKDVRSFLIRLPIFGLLVSAAYSVTISLAILLYGSSVQKAITASGNNKISTSLVQALVFAYVGARAPSVIQEHGWTALFSSKLLSRTGFWAQGGVYAGMATLIGNPFSSLELGERLNLLACLALSFTLGESIGRLGCHFAGCCGSNQQTGKRVSAPLVASALCLAIFTATFTLFLTGALDLYPAATLAVFLQALARLMMDTLRDDVSRTIFLGPWKMAPTSAVALAQAVFSLACLCLILSLQPSASTTLRHVAFPDWAGHYQLSSIHNFLAALFPLPLSFTQACTIGSEEAIEPSVFSAATGSVLSLLSLPLGMTQACSIESKEALEGAVGSFALSMLSIPLSIIRACSSGAGEAMEKFSPPGAGVLLSVLSSPLAMLQACNERTEELSGQAAFSVLSSFILQLLSVAVGVLQTCSSGAEQGVKKSAVLIWSGPIGRMLAAAFVKAHDFTRGAI